MTSSRAVQKMDGLKCYGWHSPNIAHYQGNNIISIEGNDDSIMCWRNWKYKQFLQENSVSSEEIYIPTGQWPKAQSKNNKDINSRLKSNWTSVAWPENCCQLMFFINFSQVGWCLFSIARKCQNLNFIEAYLWQLKVFTVRVIFFFFSNKQGLLFLFFWWHLNGLFNVCSQLKKICIHFIYIWCCKKQKTRTNECLVDY